MVFFMFSKISTKHGPNPSFQSEPAHFPVQFWFENTNQGCFRHLSLSKPLSHEKHRAQPVLSRTIALSLSLSLLLNPESQIAGWKLQNLRRPRRHHHPQIFNFFLLLQNSILISLLSSTVLSRSPLYMLIFVRASVKLFKCDPKSFYHLTGM